ncbi:purine-nucleoside phosphorylase [Tessaracoccus sp. MC1865]|uniref:purine-nucleoside phosphorylase n=1 Tax=Tessaracoccus sp. MC1865 TaxID=2760310 RepID=UPI0015FFF8ED|nr:purine-nucleoside phosphorylase [Tessaracoccus sp. MC1865]MBB1483805.1 purine-nucleoside phosphorylase [Tessaracoccus sp. MC1865]QTO36867.1 purine-nucleoside phosphorylase [Tessaracoccus sp. MC1865]
MATPHIACEPGDIAPLVIMPGDPKRAERIARDHMEDVRLVSDVRGIGAWTGTFDGVPVTAMASGMGVPSLSIYANELYSQFGVERICRVGTCGGISSKVKVKDVIVAVSAHTNSSVATIDVPGVSLSLAASYDMLRGAVDQARGAGRTVHVGSVYTSDFFYSSRMDIIPTLDKLGTLGVEMEAAGLYACAAAHGKEALAVLTVSDHLKDGSGDLTAEERETMFTDSLQAAVAALRA